MYTNTVLRALSAEVVGRLRLRPVKFDLAHEFEFPGKPIEHLFFIEAGMASMTTTFQDGVQVEVGMFGCESIIGVSALMGTKRSLNRVYTQIAGSGFAAKLELARLEFARGGIFQLLALRYVQAQLVQAMQSAGCNSRHNFEQRLARWLLMTQDRMDSGSLPITHDFLATMLGTDRSTVSLAAGVLQRKGLIEYTRGAVKIVNRPKLEDSACECYGVIQQYDAELGLR